jgi:multidrug efflux pump subunit AcrA (membrane-fusion protein)
MTTKRATRPWFNYLLGLACVGAIVAAILVVGPASGSQTAVTRTAKAAEGVVQSTVSGSGTLAPATKVGVNFATSGSLTGLFVSVGDHVTGGELLAEVSPSSAESSLRSAEIEEATDEAAYQDAVEGLTPAEQRQAEISAEQSRASVKSSKQSLRQDQQSAKSEEASASATIAQDEVSLKSTEQSVAVEAKSQQDALNQDIGQRGSDEKAVVEARAAVEEAKSLLATEKAKSPPDEQKLSSAESKVSAAEATLRSDEAKVIQDGYTISTAQNNQAAGVIKGQQSIDGARNTVANAQKTKASTKLRSEQTIAQARTSLASAELSLQSTLAANEIKAAPPKTSTVVSAENNVKSAQLTVEKARQTLSDTKLYAPTEGVVASIKNTVGESVTGTGTEGSSTASSGTGASAGSGAAGGGTSGTGASATSSGTGGTSGTGTGGSGTSAIGKSGGTGGSTGTSGSASSGGTSAAGTGTSGSGGSGSGTSGSGGSDTSGASSESGPSEHSGASSISDSGGGGVFHDVADTSASNSSLHDIADPSTSGASTSGSGASSSATSSESSSSSSSSFIELVDVSGYQLVVPLSESEITNVHVGQIATVTVEALEGRKFAAEVVSLPVLSTTSSGVVSYDVTFQLDQVAAGLKPGMSATAEVVVKQEEGVNVPTSAISADTVTVERSGKQVRQRVVTGLAGNTSTIVLSGLKAGETVVLPAASTTSSSGASLTSKLGSRLGGGGLGGGGFAGGGGGGGAFFRGGG